MQKLPCNALSNRAERVLRDIVASHEKILADLEPNIRVHALGDSSDSFVVRPWARTEAYWDVYWDITREVKLRFDREGISIPFPQRDVHVRQGTWPYRMATRATRQGWERRPPASG